jgi:Zn-dependent oligopeptidase
VNKPTFTPYSEKVVKTGELLLSAHTLLALYETQSSSENLREIAEEFEATMEQYKQEVYQTKN